MKKQRKIDFLYFFSEIYKNFLFDMMDKNFGVFPFDFTNNNNSTFSFFNLNFPVLDRVIINKNVENKSPNKSQSKYDDLNDFDDLNEEIEREKSLNTEDDEDKTVDNKNLNESTKFESKFDALNEFINDDLNDLNNLNRSRNYNKPNVQQAFNKSFKNKHQRVVYEIFKPNYDMSVIVRIGNVTKTYEISKIKPHNGIYDTVKIYIPNEEDKQEDVVIINGEWKLLGYKVKHYVQFIPKNKKFDLNLDEKNKN